MGAGDTDCLDANGSIIMNGGTVDLTGQSTFDYNVNAAYNGGTIIINGQEVDSIPSAMMGGRGGNKENFNTGMPEENFNREEFKGGFNKDEQRQKPERQW